MEMKFAQQLPLYMSPRTLHMILVWLSDVEAGHPPIGPEHDGMEDDCDFSSCSCSSTSRNFARPQDIGPVPNRLPPPPLRAPRRFELSPSRKPVIPSKNPARFQTDSAHRWT